jgi:hypothetical protein
VSLPHQRHDLRHQNLFEKISRSRLDRAKNTNLTITVKTYASIGAAINITIFIGKDEYESAGNTRIIPQNSPATSKEILGNLLRNLVTESADNVFHKVITMAMRTIA